MKPLQGLRKFGARGLLFFEVRGLRHEMKGLRLAAERIAGALEDHNAHLFPQQVQPNPDHPPVEVTYASDAMQIELAEIEGGLAQARGMLPTEDEILQEYERRHPTS